MGTLWLSVRLADLYVDGRGGRACRNIHSLGNKSHPAGSSLARMALASRLRFGLFFAWLLWLFITPQAFAKGTNPLS
jgi:hypothetical protein